MGLLQEELPSCEKNNSTDTSGSMLDELERKAKSQGIANILTFECDINEVRCSVADLVCASMILHHIEEPRIDCGIPSRFKTRRHSFIADFLPYEDEAFKQHA